MAEKPAQVGDFVTFGGDPFDRRHCVYVDHILPNGNIHLKPLGYGLEINEYSQLDNGRWEGVGQVCTLTFYDNPHARYTKVKSFETMSQEEKDSIIEEVRGGLTEEDLSGEKKLYGVSGAGINTDLVKDFRNWTVNASSTREAYFIVFSLGTQFFEDLVHWWSKGGLAESLIQEVLDFEDGGCWIATEIEGNQIHGHQRD